MELKALSTNWWKSQQISCIKAHISPGKEVQFSELRIKSVFIHYGLHITESFKTETFLSINFYGYRNDLFWKKTDTFYEDCLSLSNLSRDNFRTLKSSLVVLHIKILNFLILFYWFHFPFTQTFFIMWLSFMQTCPQEMNTSEIMKKENFRNKEYSSIIFFLFRYDSSAQTSYISFALKISVIFKIRVLFEYYVAFRSCFHFEL